MNLQPKTKNTTINSSLQHTPIIFKNLPSSLTITTLLIADSQGRGMEGLQPGLDVTFQGGARARNLPGLVTNIDLTPFQTIAVWVGGNDAHPRKGLLNEAQFSKDITDFLTYLSSNSPDARLILMTASRRASPAPYGNISKINSLLQGVATKNKVEICNIFRALDRSNELPTPYLEKDGMHLVGVGVQSTG